MNAVVIGDRLAYIAFVAGKYAGDAIIVTIQGTSHSWYLDKENVGMLQEFLTEFQSRAAKQREVYEAIDAAQQKAIKGAK